jgi:hypothetical protein
MRFRELLIRAVLVLALLGGAPAFGYVRTTSQKSGHPLQWQESCVVLQPDARGSIDVSMDQIVKALTNAAANWSSRTAACSDLFISTIPPTGVLDVGADGKQVVVFRHGNKPEDWARAGDMRHDHAAIGLTTVIYIDTPGVLGDGTILDADIELNGVDFTFTTTPDAVPPPKKRDTTMAIADLENTLTHELGHVQGLAHSCWDHTTPTPPLDDQGHVTLDCYDREALPPNVRAATMYAYATEGETSKRHISDDDQNGICGVYPMSTTPPACYPRLVGGCSAGGPIGRGDAPACVVALLAVVALATRRIQGRTGSRLRSTATRPASSVSMPTI